MLLVQEPFVSTLSILIPTWNNLLYLRLCIDEIRRTSIADHQIIVHVNEGTDGTCEWLDQEDIAYTRTPENVGVCTAMNQARTLATGDLLLYMNDDMVPCPGWDKALLDAANAQPDGLFYLSATMIEPVATGNICVRAPHDYGRDSDTFDRARLHSAAPGMVGPDWNGSTWPPSLMTAKMWDTIGGFSEEFSPGLYSDPDISRKLWEAGVRNFRGVGNSLVYHFMSKSLKRVKLNPGKRQFLKKWGMSSSTFLNHYLQLGQKYTGPLSDPVQTSGLFAARLKDRIKGWLSW